MYVFFFFWGGALFWEVVRCHSQWKYALAKKGGINEHQSPCACQNTNTRTVCGSFFFFIHHAKLLVSAFAYHCLQHSKDSCALHNSLVWSTVHSQIYAQFGTVKTSRNLSRPNINGPLMEKNQLVWRVANDNTNKIKAFFCLIFSSYIFLCTQKPLKQNYCLLFPLHPFQYTVLE